MYLHLGQSVVVPFDNIIGIFDLDTSSWSHRTRSFLEKAEKEGRVVSATGDIPRTFTLCQGKDKPVTLYLSQLSPATLKGRAEGNGLE